MLRLLSQKLRRLCSRLRWQPRRRRVPNSGVITTRECRKAGIPEAESSPQDLGGPAAVHPNTNLDDGPSSIRVATFNAALFSMAPAMPKPEKVWSFGQENGDTRRVDFWSKSAVDRPKSILKQSPLRQNSMTGTGNLPSKQQKFAKSKLRVSINLPDNEISLLRSRQMSFREEGEEDDDEKSTKKTLREESPLGSTVSFPAIVWNQTENKSIKSTKTVLEVLRELDIDILALQEVKAEEEKEMRPLSDLASALGMNYVFAESWAPEYGNAILSRWPIKRWRVQKIFDDTDFRNVLKATIEVPQTGEVEFHCTHLDHLDENWRMKQINAIIGSNDGAHILAGGLNSLDETDYSSERWTDIVKYYEEMGKPTPKAEVMRFLKSKEYVDAKNFAGECEPVVVIAKGQSVQGTCKYGTRVDYIMASPHSSYKFVPGSYSVCSSKGTSDHHIVKVDVVIQANETNPENQIRKQRQRKAKLMKVKAEKSPIKCIWNTNV